MDPADKTPNNKYYLDLITNFTKEIDESSDGTSETPNGDTRKDTTDKSPRVQGTELGVDRSGGLKFQISDDDLEQIFTDDLKTIFSNTSLYEEDPETLDAEFLKFLEKATEREFAKYHGLKVLRGNCN